MLFLTHDRSYSEEPFRSSPPSDRSVSCSCSSMAANISSHPELCYTGNKMRIFLRIKPANGQSHSYPLWIAVISALMTTASFPVQEVVTSSTLSALSPFLYKHAAQTSANSISPEQAASFQIQAKLLQLVIQSILPSL